MGLVKAAVYECMDAGYMMVSDDFAIRCGEENPDARELLAGMPLRHTITNRYGESVEVSVIPITVAARIVDKLPKDIREEIDWQLDLVAESRL